MSHRILIALLWAGIPTAPTRLTAQGTTPGLKVLGARKATSDVGLKMYVSSGSVRIVAWDRDSIVVRGRIAPTGKFFLLGGKGDSSYKLGVVPQNIDSPEQPSELVINVPGRRAELAVKAVDASISAEGVGGWFYSVSGAIRLSGDAEHVDAESIRGDVDLNVTSKLVKARAPAADTWWWADRRRTWTHRPSEARWMSRHRRSSAACSAR